MGHKLELLEHEVAERTTPDLIRLRQWFTRCNAAQWDRQIDEDAAAGKLEALADRALSLHRDGKTTSL
jgi:hypothetical protein